MHTCLAACIKLFRLTCGQYVRLLPKLSELLMLHTTACHCNLRVACDRVSDLHAGMLAVDDDQCTMMVTEGKFEIACAEARGAHAGALLAVGILNCGVQHENDPAYALLHDFVDKQDPVVRIGAIMGLGLAYAGTQKEEVSHLSVWENVHVAASCPRRCCSEIKTLA